MPDEYDELFDEYVEALNAAKREADAWWDSAVEKETATRGSAEGLLRRWPLGPAAHPRVIAVYREFYMKCEEITEERLETGGPKTRVVDPGSFVTEWLLDPETADLARMIAQLPYAPLGLDEEGDTV